LPKSNVLGAARGLSQLGKPEDQFMAKTMSSNNHVPFTLVCRECDAGMDIASEQAAYAAGWTDIDYFPGLPMANFAGLCPECQERFENWPTNETH
jgi:hypothetical protein